MEGAMSKTEFWMNSVPRVELDQRARDARLRLERIERLLVPRAASALSRLRRADCLFGFGATAGRARSPRGGGAPSDRRPGLPHIAAAWASGAG
jgi:hypothetical protein